ncbi:MAG: AAA family ATPase, partial [Acidimicrobiales bacterium]
LCGHSGDWPNVTSLGLGRAEVPHGWRGEWWMLRDCLYAYWAARHLALGQDGTQRRLDNRLAALVGEATQVGAKVVLCGDPKQLPEIDAGGLFASLAHRLGC